MNQELNLDPLFPYLKTRKDAMELTLLFEDLSDNLFKGNLSVEQFFKESLPYDLSSIIQKMSQDANIDLQDKNALQKFLNQLFQQISALPVIHIILAIDPTFKMIEEISTWFDEKYKKLILLDITVDKDLIGGAAISCNGRANEYSLRNQISQMRTSG